MILLTPEDFYKDYEGPEVSYSFVVEFTSLYNKTKLDLKRLQEKAHSLAHKAMLKGELQRPNTCSDCGYLAFKIYGHHEDYTKPLDVEWLCSECHSQRKNIVDMVFSMMWEKTYNLLKTHTMAEGAD